jgi:hypothetical protein
MRVMLAAFFLFSACFVQVTAGADTVLTAQEIRNKAAAAAGAEPFNYRETIVGTGPFGESKSVIFRGGKNVRRTYDRGALHSESGTFHGDDWEQTENGLTLVVPDDPGKAKTEYITTTITHVTAPFDAYVISETNPRAAGTRSYYDSTTFQRRRIEEFGAGGTTVTNYDDFGQFGTRTLPKRWTVGTAHYERTEYVAGGTTDADVVPPATRRQLVEFPSGVRSADLPLTVVDHSVYVRVTIGSRTVDFKLDTGASGIVISPELARDLALPLEDKTDVLIAKRTTIARAIVPDIGIGPLHMHNIMVDVTPLPTFTDYGVKMYGLLGFDFLAQLGVTLDYSRKMLHVVPAADYAPPTDPSTLALDVRLGHRVPMLTITVGDAVAERMVLDSGSDFELDFFDYFSRRYPKAFKDEVGKVRASGIGGRPFEAPLFTLHDVGIGRLHFQDFYAAEFPSTTYERMDADGLVGGAMMELFTVGLDYTNGRIYLTPRDMTKRALQDK